MSEQFVNEYMFVDNSKLIFYFVRHFRCFFWTVRLYFMCYRSVSYMY